MNSLFKFRDQLINMINMKWDSTVLKIKPKNDYVQKNILYTPGPLMTSETVKKAMLRDIGAGEHEFKQIVEHCRKILIDIANVPSDEYVSVILQGSGTYSVESVMQSTSEENSKFLIIENGLYGRRLGQICDKLNIKYDLKSFPENRTIDINELEEFLKTCKKDEYSSVGMIHGETSSGVLNSIEKIGPLVKQYLPESMFFVDSMCCFGAIQVDIKESKVDFLVASSNKCIQAVPGVAFVICNKQSLMKCKNNSKTLSLDLVDQYEVDLRCKLFRFTPPTHVILAFKQALIELEKLGGPSARYSTICKNHEIIYKEMTKLGFQSFIPFNEQSKIVNSFLYPKDKNFSFERFHNLLLNNGRVLFSRSLTSLEPTFRIGNIGHLMSSDMYSLIDVIKKVLKEMNVETPLKKD